MAVSKSTIATITAGLGLLVPASLGLDVTNVPTIFCPFPLITVVPAFFFLGKVVGKLRWLCRCSSSSPGIRGSSVVRQKHQRDPSSC